MAKSRGLLQNAVKVVKQQKKTDKTKKTEKTVPGSKSAPASKKPGTRPGPASGHPAAKKQKSGNHTTTPNKTSNGPQQQNQKPTIPFSPSDSILLIGEGDLSFAASLITHHRCTNVTATVLEKDLAELSAKYPHVPANISAIEDPSQPNNRLLYGIDARKLPAFTTKPPSKPNPSHIHTHTHTHTSTSTPTGTMKRILFNFPHTGGKSTDVNRQVRHNQELLVAFFQRAQPSLAPGGTIVVTLFEGEPYTLWNVRDLARHAGLQVERSFRFVAGVYPGYEHARTLGVVRNRRGGVAVGAWRGGERAARSFVFVRKGEGEGGAGVGAGAGAGAGGVKRKRGAESSDEEDEEEEEEDGYEEGYGEGYGEGDGEGDWGGESEDDEDEDEEEGEEDEEDGEEEGGNRSDNEPENRSEDADRSRDGD